MIARMCTYTRASTLMINYEQLMATMLISIHGTIGAGKTTIIKRLSGLNIVTFSEPVDEWKEELLALYTAETAEEKEKAIIGIQNAVYDNMVKIYNTIKESPDKYYFIERSCWDTYSIFVPLNEDLYLDKKIYQQHIDRAKELERLFDTVTQKRIKIFVTTTLQKAIQRTKNRGDGFDIDVEYQRKLFELHEKAFAEHKDDKGVIFVDNSHEIDAEDLKKPCNCLLPWLEPCKECFA